MQKSSPITAILPVHGSAKEALITLDKIKNCQPSPDEIIVHVDGGTPEIIHAISMAHPDVKILSSEVIQGPGGGRNLLIRKAANELVANFDDDSAPEVEDYFARVIEVAERFPQAAVISASSLTDEKRMPGLMRIGIFSGCGFVFRKSAFLSTKGFVPLKVAYCMEETDLSLRLAAAGGLIVHDPLLRVVHRKIPVKKPPPGMDAEIFANIGLLPLLRYPWYMLPLSLVHMFLRMVQMLRGGRFAGLLLGIIKAPSYMLSHMHHREPAAMNDLLAWWSLRREPECLELIHPRPCA